MDRLGAPIPEPVEDRTRPSERRYAGLPATETWSGVIECDTPNPVRRDWFVAGSRTNFDVFADTAEFEAVLGARCAFSAEVTDGRWDLFYEISRHHITGAASDRDDLMQHRVRAARTLYRTLGCELELHAQLQVWGDDLAWDLGFTFQKKFGSVHP